jgi:hypothetical protein
VGGGDRPGAETRAGGSASIPATPPDEGILAEGSGTPPTALRYRLAAPDVARAIWAGSVARPAALACCVLATALAIGLLVADGVLRLFGVMVVLVILGAPVLLWREAVRLARLHPAVVAEAQLLYSDQGLRAPAWGEAAWLPWSAIRRWHARGPLLVVELESDGGLLLLPKEALAAPGQQAFMQRLSSTRLPR